MFLKISKKCDYALMALIYLSSKNEQNELSHIKDISKSQNISEKFLGTILGELKRAGFISSKKGYKGGYTLEKNANNISIADIISLIDGDHEGYKIDFSSSATQESVNSAQVIKESLDEINNTAKIAMKEFTLKELSVRYLKLQKDDADFAI